tara:strand:- start:1025 stop:1378 length:354 start_codon:yes stop_codon:yes gene_type:complete
MLPNKVKDIIIIAAAILAVFIFVLWCASPAQAQGCSSVKEGSVKLEKNYGETPVFRGVSASGYMIVIFLNSDSGTWTAARIMPQNRMVMCPLDAGADGSIREDLEMKEEEKVEQKWQ